MVLRSSKIHPPSRAQRVKIAKDNTPHVDKRRARDSAKNVYVESCGMKFCSKFAMVEAFQGPVDGGRAKFILDNAPHEPKSRAPADEAFFGVLGMALQFEQSSGSSEIFWQMRSRSA